MNELKTVKDLRRNVSVITPISHKLLQGVLLETELKQLVIKWVKEDEELVLSSMSSPAVIDTLMMRWKDRLNITEEDLK